MRLYPILLDAQPRFLCSAANDASLLMSLLGADSLAGHLRAALRTVTPLPVTVVSPPSMDVDRYREQFAALCPDVPRICHPDRFAALVAELDMSDALLIVDARSIPAHPGDFRRLIERHAR